MLLTLAATREFFKVLAAMDAVALTPAEFLAEFGEEFQLSEPLPPPES